MPAKVAFDTNILIYSIGGGHDEATGSLAMQAKARKENHKAQIAKTIVAQLASISIQVFNEFANVARRKLGMEADEIRDLLEGMARVHTVTNITWETTRLALEISKTGEGRNPDGTVRPGNFSTYDSLITNLS